MALAEKKSFTVTNARRLKCVLCPQNYFLNQCGDFKSKSPQDHHEVDKKFRLCLICFDSQHCISECKFKFTCNNCNGKHNSMLHFESKNSQSAKSSNTESELAKKLNENTVSLSCARNSSEKFVVLPSVVARFLCNGVNGKVRLLLDSCSQPTLISDKFIRKFRLAAIPSEPYFLKGVGN